MISVVVNASVVAINLALLALMVILSKILNVLLAVLMENILMKENVRSALKIVINAKIIQSA